ncbi:MAG: ATP synthase F0 subunit B [Acidobacteria bacterium]|nr:MAG: ATP synthase F0 subunit B [Acidobacteriota bacterium]
MLIQPEPGLMIWTVVTFLLLVLLLGKFAWKPILAVLKERETTIRQALDEARQARKESASLLEQNRAILADARNQAREVLEKARQDAEQRRSDLVAAARKEAEELLSRSRDEIQREKRQALRELREEAADLAIAAASRVVAGGLDAEHHRRLVDEYFASLPDQAGDPS